MIPSSYVPVPRPSMSSGLPVTLKLLCRGRPVTLDVIGPCPDPYDQEAGVQKQWYRKMLPYYFTILPLTMFLNLCHHLIHHLIHHHCNFLWVFSLHNLDILKDLLHLWEYRGPHHIISLDSLIEPMHGNWHSILVSHFWCHVDAVQGRNIKWTDTE